MKSTILALAIAFFTAPALAHDPETVTPAFSQEIPNIPGKRMIAAVVDYPPDGASPSHRHAPSAFIFAYVLEGEIVSSVDGAPERSYRPGESWSEVPGAHHAVSRNASKTKPAKLLAVFVVDESEHQLVIPDTETGR